jgi:hypothetical protein
MYVLRVCVYVCVCVCMCVCVCYEREKIIVREREKQESLRERSCVSSERTVLRWFVFVAFACTLWRVIGFVRRCPSRTSVPFPVPFPFPSLSLARARVLVSSLITPTLPPTCTHLHVPTQPPRTHPHALTHTHSLTHSLTLTLLTH